MNSTIGGNHISNLYSTAFTFAFVALVYWYLNKYRVNRKVISLLVIALAILLLAIFLTFLPLSNSN